MRIPNAFVLFLFVFVAAAQAGRAQFPPVIWITQDVNARDWWPRVAPDGRTITFSRSTDEGRTFQMMRTTFEAKRTEPFFASPPVRSSTRGAWSRSRSRFAFTGRQNEGDTENSSIWITNAGGTRTRRLFLVRPSNALFYPLWLPGDKSVLAQDYGASATPRIVEINIRTGTVIQRTDPDKIFAAGTTISPNGKILAFVGQPNTGQSYDQMQNHLYLIRRTGAVRPREISAGQARQPDWSPDGRWIAFTSTRGDKKGRQAVFIVSPRTRKIVQLTGHELDARHPVWTRDSRRLVFSALLPGSEKAYGLATIRVILKPPGRSASPARSQKRAF